MRNKREDEMKSVTKSRTTDVRWIRIVPLAVLAAFLISTSAGHLAAQQANQKSYASPKEAILALVSAVKAEDRDQLMSIFGPEAKEILYSGDEVADKQTREKFLQKYNQMSRLETQPNGSVDLYLGAENWPFPVSLVKKNGRWLFDTAAGKKEILYRRIGRNEFDTMDTLHGLVDAQKEYVSQPRDGEGKQYAQKLLSDEGKHNGLYWKTAEGQAASPAGPLIAEAFSEGYRKQSGPVPYHGYVYRLLRSQGPNAPGGAKDYMVNGKLSGGFAILAYPAEYRNSGVMTFIVNQDGNVYQKDLGPKTAALAADIKTYNPDKTWRFVDERED
jgi:hypothetical protein